MSDNQFWTVWNPNGRVPMNQYATEHSATHTAGQWAEQYPGEIFFVLEAVAARRVNSMQRINLRPHTKEQA